MRYVQLEVTPADREKIEKRGAGEEQYKNGIFGSVELLRRLLEVSPNVKKMEDVTMLARITRKLEKIEDEKEPVLEIPEDEWSWIKGILNHDKWATFGPNLMAICGNLLEAVLEAKTEMPNKLRAVEGGQDV